MIRVVIPYHLRMLAQVTGEVQLDVDAPVTLRAVLDALEARYPMLRGTIRDQTTRRAAAVLAVLRLRAGLSRTSRRTRRCRRRLPPAKSRCWSSAQSPAAKMPVSPTANFRV